MSCLCSIEVFQEATKKPVALYGVLALTGRISKGAGACVVLFLIDALDASAPQYTLNFCAEGVFAFCFAFLSQATRRGGWQRRHSRSCSHLRPHSPPHPRLLTDASRCRHLYGAMRAGNFFLRHHRARSRLGRARRLESISVAVANAVFYGVGGTFGRLTGALFQIYFG